MGQIRGARQIHDSHNDFTGTFREIALRVQAFSVLHLVFPFEIGFVRLNGSARLYGKQKAVGASRQEQWDDHDESGLKL
jgi:hypothetical protein